MDKAIKKRIEEMSLEDKARQLSQVNAVIVRAETKAEITGKDEGMDLCEADTREIGSVLNFNGAADAIAVQDEYLSKSEGKIPLIFMQDVVHGFRTVFPVPLALGCSFDPSLAEACAEVSAVEAKYNGVQVTFSPMVDLVRDPRWGRVMESTGEDAYLNGEMGKAFVRGYHKGGILCCVKHFAAYGAAEAGKEYNTTDVSERNLKEYYLPAYRACVEEGADMVMSSFNLLNGVPVNGHKDLLVDTLRKEWGFDGVLISDYAAVKEMIGHGYLETLKECAETAINNQLDMEMMSSSYIHYLPELVGEGRVKEERIDESLRRVLELKQKAGLFENKYGETDAKRAEEVCLCPEHRALARRAAARTCVLLKNNGVLPLSAEQNIALAGPYAAEKNILGGWACWGRPEEAVSVYDGVRAALGREVVCAAGCGGKLLDKDESGKGLRGRGGMRRRAVRVLGRGYEPRRPAHSRAAGEPRPCGQRSGLQGRRRRVRRKAAGAHRDRAVLRRDPVRMAARYRGRQRGRRPPFRQGRARGKACDELPPRNGAVPDLL